ncbi:MAG: phosphotransferase [Acidobacteriota bacterium]
MPSPTSLPDRRHPYRAFDPSLIEGFLRGRQISSMQLQSAGKSNTNYKLTLSDGQTCLVRLYSQGDPVRESYLMKLAGGLVPVPRELARGPGWSVLTFLEGGLLAEAPQHCAAAARALARIGSVAFESPGWVNGDGTVSAFPFAGISGFVEQMLEQEEVVRWIGSAASQGIRSLLDREAGRLAGLDSECRLVHGDFNPSNILIRDGRVSGILDWECSHSGSPCMDIGNLLRHLDSSLHGLVEQGLRDGGMHLPDDWKERAQLVDLTSHLEFLSSGRSDRFKRQCVSRIERFLARFG